MKLLVPILLALAACGDADFGPHPGLDAPYTPDSITASDAQFCNEYIAFDPPSTNAGPDEIVRATVQIGPAAGVAHYFWQVIGPSGSEVVTTMALADNSAVEFHVTTAGLYTANVQISDVTVVCSYVSNYINVGTGQPGAHYRVAIRAPNVPPQEEFLNFDVGTASYSMGTITLDDGVAASGVVRFGSTNVPSYLRFIPRARPDQFVEAFVGADGQYTNVKVLNETHDVLVVPMVPGYAPRLHGPWTYNDTLIPVGAGVNATGTVRGPNNLAIPNASVQITIAGVPSTIDTTDASGNFSVAYEPGATGTVVVEVVPLATTGLPRLVASSGMFDPAMPFAVKYDAGLTTRSLAGVHLTRAGADVATTRVDVVGVIGVAGLVTAGVAIPAIGSFRATASTNGTGVLPAILVPAVPAAIVAEVGTTDSPYLPIDLSVAPPSPVVMPNAAPKTWTVTDAAGTMLANTRVTLAPSDLLALAQISSVQLVTNASGTVSLPFSPSALYEVRVIDPAGRGAPMVVKNATSATAITTVNLPAAVVVSGVVKQSGSANPIPGASVQVLCKVCNGVDRTRPIAEVASDVSGKFIVAVPDGM